MAGQERREPFLQLQQLVTDWERRLDAMANKVMGTSEFTRSLNALQNVQLGMQKAFLEAMASHLNNLNMPSREDVAELGEAVVALDQRMARIEAMLQQNLGGGAEARAARRGPPRTRRPPSERAS